MTGCVPAPGGGADLLVVPASQLREAARECGARGDLLVTSSQTLGTALPGGHEFGVACQAPGAKVRTAAEDAMAALRSLDVAWQGIAGAVTSALADVERADRRTERSFEMLLHSTREVSGG